MEERIIEWLVERPDNKKLTFKVQEGIRFFVYCEDCNLILYTAREDNNVTRAVARDRSLTHQDLMPGHFPGLYNPHAKTKETIRYREEI
jgi:hypothetical protein